MKRWIAPCFVALGALLNLACGEGFDEVACTDELRLYDIVVQYPLTVRADQVDSVVFETCVDGTCASESPVNGSLGDSFDGLRELYGAVRENAEGLYLDGSVQLGESTSTTHVRVRASLNGTELFVIEGDVGWEDADSSGCHTRPTRSQL